MRTWSWSNGWRALAGVVVCTTACLPAGEPPTGRQVLASRTDVLLGTVPVPSPDDGKLRVVVARPRDDGNGSDLVLVTDGGAGAMTLAEHWNFSTSSCPAQTCTFTADSRGRLLLYDPDQHALIRVDPGTGERLDLGQGLFVLSPSGDRVAVFGAGPPSGGPSSEIDIYEVDDRMTTLASADGLFIGEDFFFIDDMQRLERLTPQGAPEAIRQGMSALSTLFRTSDGPILMLAVLGAGLTVRQALFDPITLQERLLPYDGVWQWVSLSSDGRWMLGRSAIDSGFRLLDLTNDSQEAFDTPVHTDDTEWRPGRAELWISPADASQTGWIKKPGAPLFDLPSPAGVLSDQANPVHSRFVVDGGPSRFTPDGDRWFSGRRSTVGERSTVLVGSADDPTGVRFPVHPEGSWLNRYWHRTGGTLLIEAYYTTSERSDIIVVDPATGASRRVAREAEILAAGDGRVLALLRWLDGAGDLVALDLDGGGSTKLAADYAVAAYPERRSADPLGPGTRVAFQFHNRFASSYDGIWVATLP